MLTDEQQQPRRQLGENWRQPDPEPHEILAACARIRATWSDEERVFRSLSVAGGQPRKRKPSPPRRGSA